jgi:glycosyltransferase involved in cell wall biosynthesis
MKIGILASNEYYGLDIVARSLIDNVNFFQCTIKEIFQYDYALLAGQPYFEWPKKYPPLIIYWMWEFDTLLPVHISNLLSPQIKKILVDTEYCKNQLLQAGIPENKIVRVYFDFFKVFPELRQELQIDFSKKDRLQYFTFGRLHFRKNIPETVRILKQWDKPFKFKIWSGYFPFEKYHQEFEDETLQAIEGDERFELYTQRNIPQTEKYEMFKSSWAGIFLSLGEGMGIVPFEALFCGTLSILNKLPSWVELYGEDYPFFVENVKKVYRHSFHNNFPLYPAYHPVKESVLEKLERLYSLSEQEYVENVKKYQQRLSTYFENAKYTPEIILSALKNTVNSK